MYVYLLGFLFVVILPLAKGVLFTLLLRELYARHPLPLGGAIVPVWWNPPKPAAVAVESAEVQEVTAESAESAESPTVEGAGTENSPATSDASPAELGDEQNTPLHSGISVFDGSEKKSENLQVGNVLQAMTSEAPAVGLNDFERIIDEASKSDSITEDAHAVHDDMNHDDLKALAEALPGTKIDFSQEVGMDSHIANPISPTAKELLGENFDYDGLKKQAEQAKQAVKILAPTEDAAGTSGAEPDTTVTDVSEVALDIQEESGTVQVSSPFIASVIPMLADFSTPQTILSMFSNDWIQESNGMLESSEEDSAKFCFTEESRPMFVRKKKNSG